MSSELMPWEQQPEETAKAYAAFCIYRDLGAGRTIPKLREEFGKTSGKKPLSERQYESYSSRYRWSERVAAWDGAARQEVLPVAVQVQTEAISALGKLDVAVREARLADYNLIRDELRGVIEDRKADALEQLAQWEAYEAKRQELLAQVEVCQKTVIDSDPEDSEALRQAKRELDHAQTDLDIHCRHRKVEKPSRAALRGVMVRDVKSVGKEAVEVWKLDEALLRELRAADKQAAEDLGQWLQKLKLDVGELKDDQLLRLLAGEMLEVAEGESVVSGGESG